MAEARGDFTRILVQKKIISPEQMVEARTLQQQTGTKLQDAIVKLGYATAQEVMRSVGRWPGTDRPNRTSPSNANAVALKGQFVHPARSDFLPLVGGLLLSITEESRDGENRPLR